MDNYLKTEFHYFNYFSVLLFISFIFTVLSAIYESGTAHYLLSIAALAPIVFYYLKLLSKIELITHSAIDSIYYFGFLVTLLALAAGGVGLRNINSGSSDQVFNQIAIQFAIGLFATGIAIFGRMHLLFKKMKTEEVSMDDIVQKVSESVFQMQNATVAFQGAADSLVSNSKDMFGSAQKVLNDSLLESQSHFNREVEASTQTLVESMNSFSTAFSSIASKEVGASILSLAKQVAVATKSLDKLNGVTEISVTNIGDMSSLISSFSTNFSEFSSSLDKLKNSSDKINGLENLFENFYVALDTGATKVDRAGDTISGSINQISKMSEFILEAGPTLNGARTVISNFNKQVSEFSEIAEKLSANIGEIESRFQAASGVIAGLEKGLVQFTEVTNDLVSAATNSSAAISEISNNTIEASENAYKVSKALSDSMQNIVTAVKTSNEAE